MTSKDPLLRNPETKTAIANVTGCVRPVELGPSWRIGLGVCYDLRFPEMSLSLVAAGANILTYPSAFTVPTGKAQ